MGLDYHTGDDSTPGRILDAAEKLFADRGFSATSMRAITNAAGVNLAAVNYHFGSKDRLIVAVVTRGISPINRVRLERLDGLLRAHEQGDRTGKVLSLELVLDHFYRPAFEYFQDPARIPFLRLLGKSLFESGPFIGELMEREWMPLLHRYLDALKRCLSHLPEEEVLWRFHFAVGSMIFTVSQYEALEAMACASCKIREDFEPALARLIDFTAAGLRGGEGG